MRRGCTDAICVTGWLLVASNGRIVSAHGCHAILCTIIITIVILAIAVTITMLVITCASTRDSCMSLNSRDAVDIELAFSGLTSSSLIQLQVQRHVEDALEQRPQQVAQSQICRHDATRAPYFFQARRLVNGNAGVRYQPLTVKLFVTGLNTW